MFLFVVPSHSSDCLLHVCILSDSALLAVFVYVRLIGISPDSTIIQWSVACRFLHCPLLSPFSTFPCMAFCLHWFCEFCFFFQGGRALFHRLRSWICFAPSIRFHHRRSVRGICICLLLPWSLPRHVSQNPSCWSTFLLLEAQDMPDLLSFLLLFFRFWYSPGKHRIIHGNSTIFLILLLSTMHFLCILAFSGFSKSTIVELCVFGFLGGCMSCLNGVDLGLVFLLLPFSPSCPHDIFFLLLSSSCFLDVAVSHCHFQITIFGFLHLVLSPWSSEIHSHLHACMPPMFWLLLFRSCSFLSLVFTSLSNSFCPACGDCFCDFIIVDYCELRHFASNSCPWSDVPSCRFHGRPSRYCFVLFSRSIDSDSFDSVFAWPRLLSVALLYRAFFCRGLFVLCSRDWLADATSTSSSRCLLLLCRRDRDASAWDGHLHFPACHLRRSRPLFHGLLLSFFRYSASSL